MSAPLSAAERARIKWARATGKPAAPLPIIRPVLAIDRHAFRQGLADAAAGRAANRWSFGPYQRGHKLGLDLKAQPLVFQA